MQDRGPHAYRNVVIERDELRRELDAALRTAGYLARKVVFSDPTAHAYALEVLETPEIQAAIAAADGDSDSQGKDER